MSQLKTQIGKIVYNPALASFEALVTFHFPDGPQRLPVSYDAGLDADFDEISDGLLRAALATFGEDGVLQSHHAVAPTPSPTQWVYPQAA